jgi:hypothetical protein
MSVSRTFPGVPCLKFLLSLFGTTLCSLVAFAIFLYGLSFLWGQTISIFSLFYWTKKTIEMDDSFFKCPVLWLQFIFVQTFLNGFISAILIFDLKIGT